MILKEISSVNNNNLNIDILTDEQIIAIYKHKTAIEKLLENITLYIKDKCDAQGTFYGLKLKQIKGRKKWADNALTELRSLLSEDDLNKITTLSSISSAKGILDSYSIDLDTITTQTEGYFKIVDELEV